MCFRYVDFNLIYFIFRFFFSWFSRALLLHEYPLTTPNNVCIVCGKFFEWSMERFWWRHSLNDKDSNININNEKLLIECEVLWKNFNVKEALGDGGRAAKCKRKMKALIGVVYSTRMTCFNCLLVYKDVLIWRWWAKAIRKTTRNEKKKLQ